MPAAVPRPKDSTQPSGYLGRSPEAMRRYQASLQAQAYQIASSKILPKESLFFYRTRLRQPEHLVNRATARLGCIRGGGLVEGAPRILQTSPAQLAEIAHVPRAGPGRCPGLDPSTHPFGSAAGSPALPARAARGELGCRVNREAALCARGQHGARAGAA